MDILASLVAVAILHWVVLVTPGANVLVVTQLAASGQRRAACFAGLGVTAVAVIWASLALFGVHAIFAAHPLLRLALQVAGGLYLCWLAVRLWRTGSGARPSASLPLSAPAAFRLGFLTNITNPKSALFFGSVFATALPGAPSTGLLLAIVALVLVNALVWHLFLALAFSHRRVQAAYARRRVGLTRVASAMVGAFGLRLLVSAVVDARGSPADGLGTK